MCHLLYLPLNWMSCRKELGNQRRPVALPQETAYDGLSCSNGLFNNQWGVYSDET
jgi:hypothetical protein